MLTLQDYYGNEFIVPGPWESVSEIAVANRKKGDYWFSPETIRFFASRVGDTVFLGRFFISSEKGPNGIRQYSIRVARDDGSISTYNDFQGFRTRNDAIGCIRKIIAELSILVAKRYRIQREGKEIQ